MANYYEKPSQGLNLPAIRSFLARNGSFVYIIVIYILAFIFVPSFGTLENANTIIRQAAVPVIACVGMSLILVTGNIDLSMGYTVGLISIICGILIKNIQMPLLFAIPLCLGIGILIGIFNGILIAYAKVPSFIATLGSGYIVYGLAQIVGGSNSINQLPEDFLNFGTLNVFGFPIMVYYALAIVLVAYFIVHKTIHGRGLIYIGSNIQASFIAGVRIKQLVLSSFIISSILSAFCGVLLTTRVNCAQPDMGGGNFAFEAITAAVVGGTGLLGGNITIIGCLFGALIIKIIENCINILNINTFFYQSILGAVILFALIIEALKIRNKI